MPQASVDYAAHGDAAPSQTVEDPALSQRFRERAEEVLLQAAATRDAAARTQLVLKAAVLHELSQFAAMGALTAPMAMHERRSFSE